MDQPREPTRVIENGGMPYRNFILDVERARKRAAYAFRNRYETTLPWEDVENDALLLAILVETLVQEKIELNEHVPPDLRRDLCPCCGGDTWSRPGLLSETEAWESRRCSVCSWVRPEPIKRD